jgi:hypothetical protein
MRRNRRLGGWVRMLLLIRGAGTSRLHIHRRQECLVRRDLLPRGGGTHPLAYAQSTVIRAEQHRPWQQRISKGSRLGVMMEPLWSTRYVLTRLHQHQRTIRPPQTQRTQRKELVAPNMAMAIFAKIGEDQRPTTEILGIGHGQASGVQHSTDTIGISAASGVQDSAGAVAMDASAASGVRDSAGAVAIDTSAASGVRDPASAAAMDTATAGRATTAGAYDNTGIKMGDRVCPCGRWREATQDLCECGKFAFFGWEVNSGTTNLLGRSKYVTRNKPPPKPPPMLPPQSLPRRPIKPPPPNVLASSPPKTFT